MLVCIVPNGYIPHQYFCLKCVTLKWQGFPWLLLKLLLEKTQNEIKANNVILSTFGRSPFAHRSIIKILFSPKGQTHNILFLSWSNGLAFELFPKKNCFSILIILLFITHTQHVGGKYITNENALNLRLIISKFYFHIFTFTLCSSCHKKCRLLRWAFSWHI